MKHTHLAAILASLALALPSCGGDDESDPAPAAGPNPAAQTESPEDSAPDASTPPADPRNGSGGSSAADAERASTKPKPAQSEGAPAQNARPRTNARRKRKGKDTPAELIASLTPAERRRLDRDLYQQGKTLCYAYGPKRLAKDYNFPSTDPETVARLYARAYEAATPTLILPYQQGCLAGFRRHARNPPD